MAKSMTKLKVEAMTPEVGAVVVGGHLDELADVGALDGGGDAGLALEAAHQIGLERGAGEQDLDGHVGPGSLPSRLAHGSPDLAHPAAPEQTRDSVAGQNVTRVDRHVTWIGRVPRMTGTLCGKSGEGGPSPGAGSW